MSRRIILAVICVTAISILATGCMTTTQKGAAVGTGVGAALGAGIGALVGDPAMGAAIGAGAVELLDHAEPRALLQAELSAQELHLRQGERNAEQ